MPYRENAKEKLPPPKPWYKRLICIHKALLYECVGWIPIADDVPYSGQYVYWSRCTKCGLECARTALGTRCFGRDKWWGYKYRPDATKDVRPPRRYMKRGAKR